MIINIRLSELISILILCVSAISCSTDVISCTRQEKLLLARCETIKNRIISTINKHSNRSQPVPDEVLTGLNTTCTEALACYENFNCVHQIKDSLGNMCTKISLTGGEFGRCLRKLEHSPPMKSEFPCYSNLEHQPRIPGSCKMISDENLSCVMDMVHELCGEEALEDFNKKVQIIRDNFKCDNSETQEVRNSMESVQGIYH